MGQPVGSLDRVGKILLIQDFERGLVPSQLSQHWVGAGAGQACIEQLDDHIDRFHTLLDGFFGQMHVTGKPLNGQIFLLLRTRSEAPIVP